MGFRSADTNFFMTLLLISTFNQVSQSHNLEYYLYTGIPKTVSALTSLILDSPWDSYHRLLKLNKSKTKLCFLPNHLPSVKVTPILPDSESWSHCWHFCLLHLISNLLINSIYCPNFCHWTWAGRPDRKLLQWSQLWRFGLPASIPVLPQYTLHTAFNNYIKTKNKSYHPSPQNYPSSN